MQNTILKTRKIEKMDQSHIADLLSSVDLSSENADKTVDLNEFEMVFTSPRFGFIRLNGEDIGIFSKDRTNPFQKTFYHISYINIDFKKRVRGMFTSKPTVQVSDHNILLWDDPIFEMMEYDAVHY